ELADGAKHLLGVEHEVLEANLEVMVELRRLSLRIADRPLPVASRLADRVRAEVARHDREGHVAPVADDVDEAGLRQHALELLHLLHVTRGLVAPARLALARGVE